MEKTLKTFLLILTFLFILFTSLNAVPISTETIGNAIQSSIDTKLSGQNKAIVKTLYEKSGYKPLWVGPANAHRQAELITALNDPLYNYKNKPLGRKSLKKSSSRFLA